MPATPTKPAPEIAAAQRSSRAKLWLILTICAAPVFASYYTYYYVRPQVRSNYGDLIEPQRPTPHLSLKQLDGRAFEVASLKGKWVMLVVDGGACDKSCQDKLYHIRQVRLTTGNDRDRIERVWLITDDVSPASVLMQEYAGTLMLRANRSELTAWLPTEGSTTIVDHIYIVDPLGNLMMRFPKNADPNKTKKDIARLLRASSIG